MIDGAAAERSARDERAHEGRLWTTANIVRTADLLDAPHRHDGSTLRGPFPKIIAHG